MIRALITLATRLLTGTRANWIGCEPFASRPRVYFANHASHFDFMLLWSALPPGERKRTRPAAARDFWEANRTRRWLASQVFRAVLIEREHVTRANHPMKQLALILQQGESLILFPEGTRQKSGQVGEFRSGLYHLANTCPEVDLIPVYLQNLNRVLPKGEILPVPIMCSASFGAPLPRDDDEGKRAFLDRARQAVLALSKPRT